ncbi:MAG TPA: 2-(1,2-epoxy-1,2-dihydrophenyl)acetyl-CoA isomerase PaaG [Gemmatimonadaceae bacterium]|nr:2-(1,2-epoxy-1,2-dihydrophenyl)acetyl-CoA isomerase PaaG [Gemmatimonadaceae bacterium]
MSYQFVLSETDGFVARLTLNRPDVLNSFNRQMAQELRAAIGAADNDRSVRALLLTGAGRAFCAGQDLAEATPPPGEEPDLGRIVRESFNPVIRAIRGIEKPVVCAVNGVAAGAGANLALACDLVLASSEASFIQSFVKVGLVPDSGGTFFLPRLVGLPRATAMAMLGEKLPATRALEYGMIYRVCEPAELAGAALELARTLASMPTRALGLTKRAFNESLTNNLDTQLSLEEDLQGLAGRTNDYREGVAAFAGKRKPLFTGE